MRFHPFHSAIVNFLQSFWRTACSELIDFGHGGHIYCDEFLHCGAPHFCRSVSPGCDSTPLRTPSGATSSPYPRTQATEAQAPYAALLAGGIRSRFFSLRSALCFRSCGCPCNRSRRSRRPRVPPSLLPARSPWRAQRRNRQIGFGMGRDPAKYGVQEFATCKSRRPVSLSDKSGYFLSLANELGPSLRGHRGEEISSG